MASLELQCQQMLRAVVESILEDNSFKLPSPHAKAALETANQLVTWLKGDEHQQEFIISLARNLPPASKLALRVRQHQ